MIHLKFAALHNDNIRKVNFKELILYNQNFVYSMEEKIID